MKLYNECIKQEAIYNNERNKANRNFLYYRVGSLVEILATNNLFLS